MRSSEPRQHIPWQFTPPPPQVLSLGRRLSFMPLHCPKCGNVFAEKDGHFVCLAGRMELAPELEQRLRECYLEETRLPHDFVFSHAGRPAVSVVIGSAPAAESQHRRARPETYVAQLVRVASLSSFTPSWRGTRIVMQLAVEHENAACHAQRTAPGAWRRR
jgi:hypothetical protein